MTTADLLAFAAAIRDPDIRQEAIAGLLEVQPADRAEAEKIVRRARFRAAWAARQDRKRTVSLEVVGEPEPDMPRPGSVGKAFALLATLPEHQRQAVLLKHVSGYSTTETAKLLGVDRRTIARWIKSAMKKVREDVAVVVVSAPI